MLGGGFRDGGLLVVWGNLCFGRSNVSLFFFPTKTMMNRSLFLYQDTLSTRTTSARSLPGQQKLHSLFFGFLDNGNKSYAIFSSWISLEGQQEYVLFTFWVSL